MIVDNKIVKLLAHDAAKIIHNPIFSNPDDRIRFRWPSLLEYLELGSVLSDLPTFDETQPLFVACVATLCAHEEKDVVCYVYDRLFAEILNQIKSLPQINAVFLLEAIKKRRQDPSFSKVERVLSSTLAAYETALQEIESQTIQNLTLYLAWDRMCMSMRRLFDYPSTDPKFIKGLDVLKECLIESYQHIEAQGQTAPGIYRMLEAFLFYHMREENIQKHTATEWAMLAQSFQILKEQGDLVDYFYIDDAVKEDNSECYVTLESSVRVNSRLALAKYLMNQLKLTVLDWHYILNPKKIVYLG